MRFESTVNSPKLSHSSALKTARMAGGDLRLAGATAQALTILQLTTLDRVLKPYKTTKEALAGY